MLGRMILIVGVAALLLTGCDGATPTSDRASQRQGSPAVTDEPRESLAPTQRTPLPAEAPSSQPAHAPARESVIVDLDVEWQPESTLSEEERRAQRSRIEAAQDEVLQDLGPHGELHRRLTATAQMSLGVDDEGMAILRGHELVAAVHEDKPRAPDS